MGVDVHLTGFATSACFHSCCLLPRSPRLSTELQVRKSAHRFLLKSYGREMIVIFSLDLETTEWTDMNLKAVKSHKSWEKCSAQLV